MLNLLDKKTKNTSAEISNALALNFFSAHAFDNNKNNNGESRHYPPATKE